MFPTICIHLSILFLIFYSRTPKLIAQNPFLGPSGCGKTSLIKCLVGYFRPARGQISIFGYPAGHENLNIPGKNIGYMPQECKLYDELTIKETLIYFARLFMMDIKSAEEVVKQLTDILDLPKSNRLVAQLSGGQKRRVSFAGAIIHKPKLIILDEPTAGVDPIVTQSIWNYLIYLSKDHGITIVLTTHYIEEARKANRVGLMRNGLILEEDDPRCLMIRYNASTLEQAFLAICSQRIANNNDNLVRQMKAKTTYQTFHQNNESNLLKQDNNSNQYYKPKAGIRALNLNQIFTTNLTQWFHFVLIIFCKNLTRMFRNPAFIVLQFIVPILPVVLCCLTIGSDPFDTRIGVIDQDHTRYSRKFVRHIDNYYINPVPYETIDQAINDIKSLQTWGYIHIQQNFSQSFIKRINLSHVDLNKNATAASRIFLRADFTNPLVNIYVRRSLDKSFHQFITSVLRERGLQPTIANLPIQAEKAIYGEENKGRHDNFKRLIVTGSIVIVCFSMGFAVTALVITMERNDNMLDRHYVIGITPVQILTALLVNRQICNALQISIILCTCIYFLNVLDVPTSGQFFAAFSALFMICLAGMCLGVLLASLTDKTELMAIMAITLLFSFLISSGVIWPLEAMNTWLRKIAVFSPVTQGARSLQFILLRKANLWNPSVYGGLFNNFAWAVIFFALGIQRFKFT